VIQYVITRCRRGVTIEKDFKEINFNDVVGFNWLRIGSSIGFLLLLLLRIFM